MLGVRTSNPALPQLAAGSAFAPLQQWIRAFHQVTGFTDEYDDLDFLRKVSDVGLQESCAAEFRDQRRAQDIFQLRPEKVPAKFQHLIRNEAIMMERLMGVTTPVRLALFSDPAAHIQRAVKSLIDQFPVQHGMAISLQPPPDRLAETNHQFIIPKRVEPTAAYVVEEAANGALLSPPQFKQRSHSRQVQSYHPARLASLHLPGQSYTQVSTHRQIGLAAGDLLRIGGLTVVGLDAGDLSKSIPIAFPEASPVDLLLIGGQVERGSWDRLGELIKHLKPRIVLQPSLDGKPYIDDDGPWVFSLPPTVMGALQFVPQQDTVALRLERVLSAGAPLFDETIPLNKEARIKAALQLKGTSLLREQFTEEDVADKVMSDVLTYLTILEQNPYFDEIARRALLEDIHGPNVAPLIYQGIELFLSAWEMS